jgi:hypothetical protein
MVTLGFYKAVSIGLIIALVAVSGIAGYYYRLQSTQQAKPLPPTLKIQLQSQSVKFTSWNKTIVFSSSSTYTCGTGRTIPGNITVIGLNFTEDLSGRDPGSTWVTFRTLSSPFAVFRQADVTISLITDGICALSQPGLMGLATVEPFANWRVLSSGDYSVFGTDIVYTSPPTTISPEGLVANETWTVTTIN